MDINNSNDEQHQTQKQHQLEEVYPKTDEYHALRPKYTVESAEYLLRKVKVFDDKNDIIKRSSATIVELGCGTGLLTAAMMGALKGKTANIRYIATDPTQLMRKTFIKNLPEVEFIACKAESLPFPDNSVKVILAGACFHWFASEEACKELYRVLEPEGMLGYITNLPSETDPDRPEWYKDMYKLLWQSYRNTQVPFEHDYQWRQMLLSCGLFEDYNEDFSLKMLQVVGVEDCVKCFSSFGGVAAGGEEHRKEFEAKLRGVLKNHFLDKNIKFPGIVHTTEIYTSKTVKKY